MMADSSLKPKVLITDPAFPKVALDLLKTKCSVNLCSKRLSRQETLDQVVGLDAIIVDTADSVDAELLDTAGPNLKYVSTYSVGFDHVSLTECKKRNILAGHTPNVLNSCVAELAMALLLAAARRIVEATNGIRGGKWVRKFASHWLFGVEIADSVVGIVGFGRIGQAIAARLQGFQPKEILYCDLLNSDAAEALKAQRVSFDELLQKSDFVIVCTQLNQSTRHMFDEKAFKQMKQSAVFINVSRGGVVKQDALVSALENGEILAAGLDVMEIEPIPPNDPILKLDNCVMTPHNGTATNVCRGKMAVVAVKNVLEAMEGKEMPGKIPL